MTGRVLRVTQHALKEPLVFQNIPSVSHTSNV